MKQKEDDVHLIDDKGFDFDRVGGTSTKPTTYLKVKEQEDIKENAHIIKSDS